jgi:TetR/AcrR family transcriptional regulator, transcriptional repressor for nem operon
MPRERAFSTADVSQAIARTFSAHGYSGTSVAMLIDATRLGKQSLYNAFGDKDEQFRRAVNESVDAFLSIRVPMQQAKNGRDAIEQFFTALLGACLSDQAASNRCIVTCALLDDALPETLRTLVQNRWSETRELLREFVERGQKDRSITWDAPSAEVTDWLMHTMGGLRTARAAGMSNERLVQVTQHSLRMLD